MLERAQSLFMRERHRRQRPAPSYECDDTQQFTNCKPMRPVMVGEQENVPQLVMPRRSASVKQNMQHRVPFAPQDNGVRLTRTQSARVSKGSVRNAAPASGFTSLDRPLPPLPTRREHVDKAPQVEAFAIQRPDFAKKPPFWSTLTYPPLPLHELDAERRPELRHTDEMHSADTLQSQRATVYIVTGTYGT